MPSPPFRAEREGTCRAAVGRGRRAVLPRALWKPPPRAGFPAASERCRDPPVPGGLNVGIGTLLQAIPFDQLLIQTINGIVAGMILALVASGLTLIFGIMDVVNFAHGELFMLGAYVGVIVLAATGDFWIALVVASLLIALLGAAIYLTTLRPLLGRDPLTTILATFGISLVLQNYALWQFGPVARKIQEPFTGHFKLFYFDYPWYWLLIALLSAAIIRALWLFLRFGTYCSWS